MKNQIENQTVVMETSVSPFYSFQKLENLIDTESIQSTIFNGIGANKVELIGSKLVITVSTKDVNINDPKVIKKNVHSNILRQLKADFSGPRKEWPVEVGITKIVS